MAALVIRPGFAAFFALLAIISFPLSSWGASPKVTGSVDGVSESGTQYAVVGWACALGSPSSISVTLYVGGPSGSGTKIGTYTANAASDAGIANACQSTGKAYGYSIPLAAATLKSYGGKAIYVYGVSGSTSALLSQSGTFKVPTANALTGAAFTLSALAPGMVSTIGFDNPSYAATSLASSPVTAGPNDVSKQFVAPNGRTVTATVQSPVTTTTYNAPALAAGENPIEYFNTQILNAGSGSTLIIPKGTYNFPAVDCTADPPNVCLFGTHILVVGLHDMVIDGQGSTLNFQSDYIGVTIYSSSRIIFKNFTIDWPNLQNAAVGTVTSVQGNSTAGYTYSLQLAPGATVNGGFDAATAWDSVNNYWSLQNPQQDVYTTSLPPFTFSSSGLAQNVTSYGVQMTKGESLLVRNLGNSEAVSIYNSNDVTMNNIIINAAPSMGYLIGLGRGFHMNNCQVTRSNGRPISTTADAVHFGQFGGDVIIENSTFAYQGDDGLNINTYLLPVAPLSSCRSAKNNCPSTLPSYFNAQQGDTVALFDPTQKFIAMETAACTNGTCTANIAPIAAQGGFAADMNLANARFILSNNTFAYNRARGALLQTPYGLVQGNTFTGQSLFSLYFVTSSFWDEGPGAQNVLVLGNSISSTGNSGSGAVMMVTENSNGVEYIGESRQVSQPPLPGTNQNIVFAENTFQNLPGPAFYISSANNTVLFDNTIGTTNLYSITGTPNLNFPVVIEDASNVLLDGNSFTKNTNDVSTDASDTNVQIVQ